MVDTMVEKFLKGDYLLLDEKSNNKIVYLYPQQDYADSEISDKEHNGDELVRNQISKIEDECEGQILKIYKNNLVIKIEDNNKEFITVNKVIEIKITKENKSFQCSSKILGMNVEGKNLIIILSIPVIDKQVDRRRFFRLNTKLKVRYCFLPKGDEYKTILDIPKGCFLKTKKTFSLDISAGGIKIISEERCEIDTYVLLNLYMPNKVDILCKVIRIETNKSKFLLCMKYVYIEEKYRDIIVEFVIKKEALKRRIKNEHKL